MYIPWFRPPSLKIRANLGENLPFNEGDCARPRSSGGRGAEEDPRLSSFIAIKVTTSSSPQRRLTRDRSSICSMKRQTSVHADRTCGGLAGIFPLLGRRAVFCAAASAVTDQDDTRGSCRPATGCCRRYTAGSPHRDFAVLLRSFCGRHELRDRIRKNDQAAIRLRGKRGDAALDLRGIVNAKRHYLYAERRPGHLDHSPQCDERGIFWIEQAPHARRPRRSG